ncbi:hypothetical protein [Cytobacillus sp. IB215665]|uniref:hypothetical protein n=1 Tax=Cytobacillus sp. IB215665 TaxID=3097357 RepID=UPI002A180228|nr:hypothetical protein [Cytobacillus sp. IB215665]MDX8366010.1 hypothetical protein [Cytobacillus sp. IB215665]
MNNKLIKIIIVSMALTLGHLNQEVKYIIVGLVLLVALEIYFTLRKGKIKDDSE